MKHIKEEATRRAVPMPDTSKRLQELNFGDGNLSYNYFWYKERLDKGTILGNFAYPAYDATTIYKELNKKIALVPTEDKDDKFVVKLEENGGGYVCVQNQVSCVPIYDHNIADACARLWIQLVENKV